MGALKEKVSFIHGLTEGLELNTDSKEGKILSKIIELLDDMAVSIEENEASISELDECINEINDELDEIEEDLYGEDEEEQEDFVEIECPSCGDKVYFDQNMLESDETLVCPSCGNALVPSEEEV